MADVICPECKAGKHGNCVGIAWDFDLDEPVECVCSECRPDDAT